jgi:urease accessory protein UreF
MVFANRGPIVDLWVTSLVPSLVKPYATRVGTVCRDATHLVDQRIRDEVVVRGQFLQRQAAPNSSELPRHINANSTRRKTRQRSQQEGRAVCVSAGKMLAVVLKGWLAGVTSLSEKRQYAFHWGCAAKVKRKEGATAEGQ